MESVWSYEHQSFNEDPQVLKIFQKMDSNGFHKSLNCVKIFWYLFRKKENQKILKILKIKKQKI